MYAIVLPEDISMRTQILLQFHFLKIVLRYKENIKENRNNITRRKTESTLRIKKKYRVT